MAITNQVINQGVFTKSKTIIIERNGTKRTALKKKGWITQAAINENDFKQTKIILLAVKPQDVKPVYHSLTENIKSTTLIISIMAGIPLNKLINNLNHDRVVRAMPNLAATEGLSVTAWLPNNKLSRADLSLTGKFISSFGSSLQVPDDDAIDKVTVLTGSGPGYVYAFMDDLIKAAKSLGFTEQSATTLAQEMLIGAVAYLQSSNETPETLVKRVSSKKGITEQAVKVLRAKKTQKIWEQALKAAYKRAKQLSKSI